MPVVVEAPSPGWEDLAARAVEAVLERAGIPGAEVSVTFCGEEFIRELNRTYLGEDAPTDVLSFPLFEAGEWRGEYRRSREEGRPFLLGEIAVSLERVTAQARERGVAVEEEAALVLVHGALHLLGYDHRTAEEARAMEEEARACLARLSG